MDWLGYLGYCLAGLAGKILPVAWLCRLGAMLGTVTYYLLPQYRRLAERNVAIAFEKEMGNEQRRRLVRRHFAQLGANLLGSIGVAQLKRDRVLAVAEVEGAEIVQRLIQERRGYVVVIAHMANWELLSQVMPLLFTVTQGTIYQRLGNALIDARVRESRARLGVLLFERKEGFQGALKILREGGGVGVLADQHAGDAGVWCPFFGRLASTSSLPAMLALRSGAALVPVSMATLAPGKWRLVFRNPPAYQGKNPNEATAAVNRALEECIRSSPADWFWVHNRWKTPKPKFLLENYKRGIVTGESPLQPFRMVIRSTNWLGDAVMTTPAVRAIKRGRPDAYVAVLAPAKLAQVWEAVAEVDEVIPFGPEDNPWAVAQRIRGKFEVAIILPNSFRSALEAWLAGVPRRVGYPGHGRAWLLNQVFHDKKKKAKAAAPVHQVHHYLRLAKFIGAKAAAQRAPDAPFHQGDRLRLAVCPGAEYGPAKRWPAERFAEAMRGFSAGRAVEWILVGVAKDAPIAAEIVRLCGLDVTDLTGKTSIRELIVELQKCAALLTNDTGTMHLAALLETPVVAIFGSTEPTLTGPLGPRHRVLRHHVECSPCFLRECPLDFRCMEAVTPGEAVRALEEVVGVN